MKPLTCLALTFALSACGADVAEPEITHVGADELSGSALKADLAGQRPAVARIADDGRVVILEDRLSRTFADGGPIRRFAISRLEDGLNLLRLGTDASGVQRSDAIPLVQVGRRLVVGELKWIVACAPSECSSGFCRPNHEKTDCFCAAGEQCRFGIDSVPYDTVVIGF